MPATDLRSRLQRLRAHKARREAAEAPPPTTPSKNGAAPARVPAPPPAPGLPGKPMRTPLGTFQLIENRYRLDYTHGPRRLADMLAHGADTAARLARDDALAQADLRRLAFIDTETTGLAGGAGTLVFLVGVGVWDDDEFVLRQYFMPDPTQEPALLATLVDHLAPCAGWVTFNGRAFDLPLLETRLTLNRQRGALGTRPHLDLLMPARRLYRGRLASCSLGHLEQHVFNILRDQDDVPGYLIPQMYVDYLRTGDPRDMRRVIYHNTVDILTMVTLAAHLLEVFASDQAASANGARGRRAPKRSPEDWLRLALWHDDNARPAEAEQAFRAALAGRLSLDDRRLGLRRLAGLLRRQGRRAEAVPLWEQMASFTLDDPEAFVELAKHYEWHARNPAQAVAWTERALAVVAGWPRGWQREAARQALERRLARVQKKLAARGG